MKEAKDYNPSKDPRLIDCKTECGNDKCYARRYGLFAEKTCPNFVESKPTTNADKLRAMTDEELAVWMVQWTDCYECVARTRGCCQSDESCASSICNWLKQEADNGK